LIFNENFWFFGSCAESLQKSSISGVKYVDSFGWTSEKKAVQTLLTALKYLTVWGRFSSVQPSGQMIGTAAAFFPVVGLILGLLLAVSNYVLVPYLHPEILSVVLITVLIVGTGGIHLEGLKQTFGTGEPEKPAEYRRENESLGFVAIVLVVLFKVAAADSMDEKLASSLLLTPVLARWALVIFIYGYSDRCEQTARLIAENVRLWHLLIATLGTVTVAVYFLARKGLWVGLLLSLFALLTRTLLHRRQTLLTHANFGAIVELEEVLCLILLASL
jgi:adenosylcobinamide-GDP ribazoletransferase